METSAPESDLEMASEPSKAATRQILSFTYFTFVVYMSVGLPLAILPAYVHLRMGFSAAMAGLVISIQYIATLLSRPWAGRISDHAGAKVSVIWGMGACTASGVLLLVAAALHRNPPWLAVVCLLASRLVLGVGESLGSTGATLWGITAAGPEHTAKVISWNGISTYGALALGAPLGVVMAQYWGLESVAVLTVVLCGVSVIVASAKRPVPVVHGEHLPFRDVLGRVTPHGMGLALGGVGYSVLATFVTLFYASRNWNGAALCLTSFGVAFIAARLLFIHSISRFGGFPVSKDLLAGGVAGRAAAVVGHVALDGLWRRGVGGVRLLAGVPRAGRRGGEARATTQPRHGARRLHGVCGCVVLPGWPGGRCSDWGVGLRQRLLVCTGVRAGVAGDCGGAGAEEGRRVRELASQRLFFLSDSIACRTPARCGGKSPQIGALFAALNLYLCFFLSW